MSGYSCKECGSPASIEKTGLIRTCEHTGTVIATMSATVYGEGHACEDSGVQRAFAAFHQVGLNVLAALRARV